MTTLSSAPSALQRPDPPDVAILSWPDNADALAELARKGKPRLLLVAPDASPPSVWDPLTDWLREPADERDVTARVAALQSLVTREARPTLDEFDVLWRGPRWTALSPLEARMMELLLAHSGSVVSREQLHTAWPNLTPGARAVDARLTQLRERIAGLGLRVHTVRGRGFLLEVTPGRTTDETGA